jgi:hypothetical protein
VKRELLQTTAPIFFGDLHSLFVEHLVLHICTIDDLMYSWTKDEDRFLYMGNLERKRDDMVRCTVLQFHTAIEDLLTDMLFSAVLGTEHRRSQRKRRHTKHGQAVDRIISGFGFRAKMDFAIVVGVINAKRRERLLELNGIRNKCSHNWLLNVPVHPKKKVEGKKPRLLTYRGKDLHQISALKEFVSEYGGIYLKLYAKSIG